MNNTFRDIGFHDENDWQHDEILIMNDASSDTQSILQNINKVVNLEKNSNELMNENLFEHTAQF